jgi:hypothetical protein
MTAEEELRRVHALSIPSIATFPNYSIQFPNFPLLDFAIPTYPGPTDRKA